MATLSGGNSNDTLTGTNSADTIGGGFGNDTLYGGGGADSLTGGASTFTDVVQKFSWAAQGANGSSITSGFTQNTGSINVAFSYTDTGAGTGATIDTATTQYVAAGESYATNSAGNFAGTGTGTTSTLDFTFTAAAGSGNPDTVSNLNFRINDIDASYGGGWIDKITILAYDANGNAVPVTLTLGAGSNDTISGGTITAGNAQDSTSSSGGSVLVSVAGPVHRIVIDYSNLGANNSSQFITLFDLSFAAKPLDEDVISGGSGADSIYGGVGNDSLSGDGGTDLIYGGDGNDSLLGGTEGDTLYGDAGNDVISGEAGTESLFGGAGQDTLYGGADADTLTGDAGNDLLYGGDAADSLYGGADQDTLSGDAGNDNLFGGDAADVLYGGADQDTLTGDAGYDSLYGDAGNDSLSGGTGEDVLWGGLGNDGMSGGDDADRFVIETGGGSDTVAGGEGGSDLDLLDMTALNAAITASWSAAEAGSATYPGGTVSYSQIERLATGSGNDTLTATGSTVGVWADSGAGADRITGSGSADTLYAGEGDDSISAAGGADSLWGGAGADTLWGGLGNDTVWGGTGADSLYGEDGNDSLFGEDDDDRLDGGAGADTLDGGLGQDNLFGGSGTDSLRGGAGNDSLSGDDGADSLSGEDGLDTLYGGIGADVLDGGTGEDQLYGGADGDTLRGGQGGDILSGDDGADSLQGEDGNDRLDGGTGADTLEGGLGDDTLYGGTGNDVLTGGGGLDQLFGGAGDDTLYGGATDDLYLVEDGADLIYGGGGNDTFQGGIGDTVVGAGGGSDLLDLSAWGWARTNVLYTPGDSQSGKVQFLDAGGAVVGTMGFSNIEKVMPCFTPGTRIATARGPVEVQDLVPGEMVLTRDHGLQPLRWIGRRDLGLAELIAAPRLRPVRIARGALGGGLPRRDLLVSPQHRMLIGGWRAEMLFGEPEVLVTAKHLCALPGVDIARPREVSYLHLLFDAHEIIAAEGAWTESFQPAERMVSSLEAEVRAEIEGLFPDLSTRGFPAARLTLKAHEARVLLAA